MEMIIKIWTFFNSKKTAIGAFLLATSEFAGALGYPEYVEPINRVGQFFAAVGLGHKGKKALTK